MINNKLPLNFIWGSGSSAYQVEGAYERDGKGLSVWDTFSHIPGNTFRGTNGDIAVDHYHRYKEDVSLMAELGLKAYCFSISWPRVFPEGSGAVNEQGAAFYEALIDECIKYKIEPIVTLYHWDLPQALQTAYGGWEDRRCIDAYLEYAKYLFTRFKGKVKYWITINGQNFITSQGWLTALHPPGKLNEEQLFFQVNHHMYIAHAKAVQALKKIDGQAQIGASFSYTPSYAFDCAPENAMAKMNYDELHNFLWTDVYIYGRYPKFVLKYLEKRQVVLDIAPGDQAILLDAAQKVDFMGINYYSTRVCEENPIEQEKKMYRERETGDIKARPMSCYYKNAKNPYLEVTDWDSSIDASGLRLACREITSRYQLPILITENGLGTFDYLENGEVHDTYRIEYLRSHIKELMLAIDEGCDIIGYCVWSFTDMLSWLNGYQKRYGLVYVDRADQSELTLQRYKKDSFYWYKKVIASNGDVI